MRSTLMRLASVDDVRGRTSAVILVLVLSVIAASSAFRSIVRPFWYDEVITVIMCHLSNASEVWKALDNAADANPPLYYVIARLAHQLVPDDHLGYRLPSILGLLGAIVCVYIVLSRRVTHLAALAGATFVLCTLSTDYAAEARPYTLMAGCVAAAILSWQRIDDTKWYRFTFAIALAAAVSFHYYAILVWPAIAVAETVVWLRSGRRFRVHTWAALFAGLAPFCFFGNTLVTLRRYYGQNFWAKPSATQIFSAHDALFSGSGHWGLTLVVGVSVLLAVQLFLDRTGVLSSSGRRRELLYPAVPIHECVLAIVLLWLPSVAILAAKLSHGGMTTRYMMPAVLGGGLIVGYLSDRLLGVVRAVLLLVLLLNVGFSFAADVKTAMSGSPLRQRKARANELRTILAAVQKPHVPIVISSGLDYLPLAYYTPANNGRRLYALTDPAAAVVFCNTDSVDLSLRVLRRYYPLQVEDYAGFALRQREFLLVSSTGQGFDWWPARLVHDGHVLRLVRKVGGNMVYDVTVRSGKERYIGTVENTR